MITTTLLLINWGNALIVVGIGFGTVFIILVALVILLNFWSKMSIITANNQQKKKNKKAEISDKNKSTGSVRQSSAPEEVFVAIAMALHSYFEETHDIESNIITMNMGEQHTSRWSLKNYDMNNLTTKR